MQRNIRLYPWYRALTSAMAWLPIFFLYFSENLSLREVLLLETVYYVSVVLLEVPSGYFSDVLGRRVTLILSSLFFTVAYFVFATFPAFPTLALAQFLLAAGISMRSGTDTVMHYESLQAAGLSDEYGAREARVEKLSLNVSGVAVLLGGLMGSIHLSWGYWLSFIFVLPTLIFTFLFKEPQLAQSKQSLPFIKQVVECFRYLTNQRLRWIFVFAVSMYVLNHVPYEFYQSYLKILEDQDQLPFADAAMASGILFAITRFIGGFGAGFSIRWKEALGLKKLLILAFSIQVLIIAILGIVLHPLIILILLFRNFSVSLTTAPINAEVAPRIAADQRATYFSLQSLFSRMGFALTLFILSSAVTEGADADWDSLSFILQSSAMAGLVVLVLMMFIRLPKSELADTT